MTTIIYAGAQDYQSNGMCLYISLVCVCVCVCVCVQYWGLNSGPAPWATPPVLFRDGFFQDRVSWTICPSWLWTEILLISISWIARITGVSHWHWLHYLLFYGEIAQNGPASVTVISILECLCLWKYAYYFCLFYCIMWSVKCSVMFVFLK
jgi:hypothetical protein